MAAANDDVVATLLAEVAELKARVHALEEIAVFRAGAVALLRAGDPDLVSGRQWERELTNFLVDALSDPDEHNDLPTLDARRILAAQLGGAVKWKI